MPQEEEEEEEEGLLTSNEEEKAEEEEEEEEEESRRRRRNECRSVGTTPLQVLTFVINTFVPSFVRDTTSSASERNASHSVRETSSGGGVMEFIQVQENGKRLRDLL